MGNYEVVHSKSRLFYDRYERKADLQQQTHYCPGCGHGVVHKLIAEALEDLGLQDRTIFISPVGCSVFAYYYFDAGNVQVAHGRAPAAATGIKRMRPESIVIAYQGDGDLAAIGTAEIVHAANRGEAVTIFFVNNAVYGMTGGQMAPTTLVGQTSTTTPFGRRPANEGFPLRVCELLASLEAPAYLERVALSDNKNVMRARRAVRKAIELQRDRVGFSLVEILAPCPTIWKMEPTDAQRWVAEKMIPAFPLGVFRDRKPQITDGAPPQKSVAEVLGLEPSEAKSAARRYVGAPLTMKLAGFGGQGVLLLGQVLAEIGMREGAQVSWLPSYGPEMRSGSAHCHVCISPERIGSPLVSHPQVLVAMNEISLRKFAGEVTEGGTIFYNRDSLPADLKPRARVICVPASEMADGIGLARAANMVLLGALTAEFPELQEATAVAVLKSAMKASAVEPNLKALGMGRDYVLNKVEVGPVSQADGYAD